MKTAGFSRFSLARAAALVAAAGFVLCGQAFAQTTYYWDANDSTAGFGTAGGTWAAPTTNNSTQGWSTSAAGTSAMSGTTTTNATDALNFGTGSAGLALGTITVSGTVNANSLTFGSASGNITLSGGTITLGGTTPTITTNNTADTISSVLAGSAGLTKNGTGTLTLNFAANNTYTGATTITAGTLVLKPTSAFNGSTWSTSSNTTINSGGRLVIDTTAQTAVSSQQAVGNITVNSGGTLELTNTVTTVDYSQWSSGTILGSGTLIKSGAGYQGIAWSSTSATGFNNFNGTVLVNAGTLAINKNAAIGNGQVDMTVASGASFDIRTGSLIMDSLDGAGTIYSSYTSGTGITLGANNGSGNFSGVIQNPNNTMTLTKNGSGTQVLSGTNTYTGATTINAGTIEIGGAGQLGSGSYSGNIALNGTGSTLSYNSTASQTLSGTKSGNGSITKNGTGTLTISGGVSSFTGTTTVNSGTLTLGASDTLSGGSLIVNSGATVYTAQHHAIRGISTITLNSGTLNNSDPNTYLLRTWGGALVMNNGTVTGIGDFGAGSYTLSGNNTIGISITAGSGPFDVTSGTTSVTSGISYSAGGGPLTKNGSGTLSLGGNNTYSGTTTINNGTLEIGAGGRLGGGSYAGAITNNATFIFGSNSDQTLSGVISGTGALTKNGTGTLTLSNAANTYNGTTTINAGTLAVSGNISSSAITLNSGGVISAGSAAASAKFNAASLTVAGGSGYAFTIGNVGASVAGTDYDQIALSGALTLNNTSANPFTIYLNGTPTSWSNSGNYSWDLITAASQTGFNSGNFSLNFANFGIASGNRTGTWAFANPSGGTIRLSYTAAGADAIWSGGAGSWSSGFSPGVTTDRSLVFTGAGGAATNDIASGTLSSINFITFNSTAGSYTLAANSGSAGASGGTALTVKGDIINNSANAQTIDMAVALGGSSTGIVNTASGNITISGAISGPGGITKQGNSTLTLTGNNTYAGVTTISAGTLQIGGAGLLGGGNYSNTISNSGTLLSNSTGNQTLGGIISGAGALTKNNTSTLTLTASNSYTGATTINAGTLALNGNLSGGTAITTAGTAVLTQGASSIISGTSTLTQNSSGTSTLAGNNTYSGTTTVSAGTLTLTGASTGGGAVMVDGGTMNIQGNLTLGSNQFTVGNSTAGTVNHSAGTVTITSGNGLIVGGIYGPGSSTTSSSSNGTYNFSGGVLNITPGANRGISIGWNSNSRGTFNMSGGTLTNSGTLQIGQTTDFDTTAQLPSYIQTGGDATHGTLTMGGNSAYRVHTTTTTLSITGGNFTANNFTVLASGSSNTANILIGGNAIVTLPAFPTSRGSGATAYLTFNGGTLRPTASSATYISGLTSATINSGGVTFDTNSYNITVSQALLTNATSTGGGLTKNGTGTLTLSGNNTFTGTTTINTGTLEVGGSGLLGAGSYSANIANNGTLLYNGTNSQTLSGVISGSGALTKANSGSLILSGANTYNGTTTINAGTLQMAHASALGSGGNITFSGGALQFGSGITTDISSRIKNSGSAIVVDTNSNNVTFSSNLGSTNSGGLTKNGTGTLILGTDNTYSGTTTVNAGTLQLSGNISSSALTIGNGGIVSIGTTSAVAKYNASSLTLQGGSGYAFTIGNVNASVAGTDYDQLTATGALTLSNTAASPFTVYLNGTPTGWTNSGTYSWNIISAASMTGFTAGNFSVNLTNFGIASSNRTGTWTFTNSATNITLTYAAATPDYIWSGTSGNWSTGFTPTAPVTDKNLVFTGSGGTATNDIGNGTLSSINFITFNSTAGAYTLNATTGAAGLAGGTALTVKGDILNNSSNAQTIAMNLAFGSSSTGGVDTAAGNITISGNISGTGALNKAGNSTLTLTGVNTYTGTTTINAGTLQVGNATTGSIASTSVVNNANLLYGTTVASGTFGLANSTTGTGNLTATGQLLKLNGNITQSGNVSLTGSTATGLYASGIELVNDTTITAGNITLTGDLGYRGTQAGNLSLNTSATNGAITINASVGRSGVWYGLSSFTANAGTGNLTVSGANLASNWAVNAATLTGALNISSGFTSGGPLNLNATGNSTIAGNLALASSSTNTWSVNPNLTMTVSGNISGTSAALVKNGNGTLTLSGTNTYSGGTTVNAGTLQVTTNGGIAGGLTINGTGVAQYSVNATNYFGSLSSLALTNGGTFIDGSIGSYTQTTPTLTFNNGGTISSVAGATGDVVSGLGNLLLADFNVTGTGLATINATAISFNYSRTITVADTVAGAGVDLEISSIIRDGRSSGQTLTKAGAGTLRLSGNNTSLAMWTISAGTLEIGAAGRLTSGNYAANITNNGAFIYSGTNNQILSGVISGSGALTQNASSTLTLSGNNTYSSTTTINAGTIEIGAAGRLGAGTYAQNITNNGTLIYSGTNAQTLSGVISGTGNLTQNASSTLTLSGANTYTGTTTVNAGTLAISNNMTIGAIAGSGNLSLGSGFTLTSNSTSNSTFSGVISGSGALAKNGASSLTLGGNNTYSGATTISAGTIEIGAAGSLGGGNYSQNIANNGVLIYSGTNNQTLGGVISGTGALTHNASSTLTLTGNNTYNGATTVSAGTLVLNGNNSASAVTIASGATLKGSGSAGATTVSGTIAPGNSPGTLTVGSLTLNGGGVYTWEMADAIGAAGTGWDRIASTGLLTVNSTSGSTFTIAITSSGAPSNWNYQTASQSWDIITYGSVSGFDATKFSINATAFGGTLGGSASTWALTDTGSALRLTYTYAADPIWAGGTGNWTAGFSPSITNGANSTFTGAGGTATNNIASATLSSIGSITFNSTAGAYTINANSGSSGYDTASAFTLGGNIINNSNAIQTINLALTSNTTRVYDAAAGNITIGGAISGTGGLTKNGSNTLALSGVNTYNGSTTINNGTLTISGAGQLGSGSYSGNISNSGTFNYASSANQTLSGIISGTGALTMNGASTLTLSGNNTYNGTTTISAGTIQIAHANGLGTTGNITFAGGGLQYGSGITTDVSSRIKNSGAAILIDTNSNNVTFASAVDSTNVLGLTKNGTGTLTLNATNTYTGTTTINTGTLQIGSAGLLGGGNYSGNIANSGSFVFGSNSNQTLSGNISGTGSLTKNGSGTLTLSSNNTYSGGTTLSAGQININAATALGNGTLTIAGGTIDNTSSGLITLSNNNTQSWNGDFAFTGTKDLNIGTGAVAMNASRTVTVNAGNFTIGGNITGSTFGLTKNGSGTMILTGANTYNGTTTINAGTLTISGGSAIADAATVSLANAAGVTFNVNGNETIGSLQGGGVTGGSVALASSQTLTVAETGSNSFNGSITGAGNLIKSGAGNMTLTGTSTFNGTTTISAGKLVVNGSAANSAVTIASGGTLGGSGTVGATIVSGTISPGNSPGTLSVGAITLNSGGVYTWEMADATGAAGTGWDRIASTGLLTVNSTSGSTFTIAITSSGVPSNWNYQTANQSWDIITYGSLSGFDATKFSINATAFGGTVGANNTSTWALIDTGSALRLTYTYAADPIWAGGTGNWTTGFSPAITNGANATFTGVGGTATNNIASATLSSLGSITFNSTAGAYTINANSGSSGYDTASAFTLGGNIINNSTATQTINLALTSNATRVYDAAAGNITIGGPISGTGGLTKNGSNTLALSDVNTYTGATTINAGTLTISGAGQLGSGNYSANISNAGTFNYASSANQTLGGIISGNGALTQSGASNLTLTGVNTYTGATTITAGTLTIGGAGQLGSGNYSGNIANNGVLAYNSSANQTLGGTISGTGDLIKNGNSTLTLTHANTYNGSTTINAGTLSVTAANGLGATTEVTIDGGSLLVAASNVINDTADITMGNNGTLVLSGSVGEVVGQFSLTTNTTAIIDMGYSASWISFWKFTSQLSDDTKLWIYNYTVGSDHVYIRDDTNGNVAASLPNITFYSGFGSGFLGSGFFDAPEVHPHIVPEPGTYATAALLLIGLGIYAYRRRRPTLEGSGV